jgi:F-type H+-transporting ATPase subunit a
MAGGLHISIEAEPILTIGGLAITNSLAVTFFVSLLLIVFALWFKVQSTKKKQSSFYVLIANFLTGFYNFFEQVAGEKTQQFYPLLATFFLFIILSNWIGLLPGFGSIGFQEPENKFVPILRGPTADLNTTLVLALISVASIQYFGIKNLGFFHYIKKFINLRNPIDFVVGLLEINSEVSKIISFAFRLFGNIFAGEVLLAVIGYLIPVLAPLPFLGLEVFVGFIQALVFTMLSLIFMSVASSSH